MRNIFHFSHAFLEKHKRHHHLALAGLALVVAISGAYTYRHEIAQAATYTFTQTSWAGGADTVTTASHASNQSGWNKYYSQSSLSVGGNVSISSSGYSFTDDGTASTTSPDATGGGFGNGTNSSTTITGSGSGASVRLTAVVDGGTGANGAYTCASGTCSLPTGTYNYTTFNISSGATVNVTGNTAPLVIKATGNVTIAGTLNANGAAGGAQGAGGAAVSGGFNGGTTSGAPGAGAGGGGAGPNGAGAGGGGSYGALGGNGAASSGATCGITGKAGCYNATDSESFGGGGPSTHTFFYSGGASGGNIKIQSVGTISVTGSISANGGAGASAGASLDSGGGGSGGRILLFSGNVVQNTGTVTANGASGGSGFCSGGGGGGGRIYVYGGTGTGMSVTGGSQVNSLGSCGGPGLAGTAGSVTVGAVTYTSSGTFTSAVINMATRANPTTLAYTATLGGQTITVDARAGNTAVPDGTWTAWQTGIASGGSIAGLAGNQYIQYRANLSTANSAVTPTLDSVTINYNQYASSGNLISSKYDSGSAGNLVNNISWSASGTDGVDEIVKFQVRSATTAGGLDTAPWCGQADCSGNTYFTTSGTSNTTLSAATGDHEWFQYKAFLLSGGDITPVISSVTVQYVVNAAPSVGNILPAQITDSASVDYNKVSFSFDVSDSDTTTGSPANQYKVTPTLYEYSTNGGSSWTTISSGLSANAYSVITLTGNSATTTTTVVWDPAGTNAYANNNAKIRVSVTDGEAANFSAVGTSGTFTLDSKTPVISYVRVDSSTANNPITWSVADDTALSYRISNSAFASLVSNESAWTLVSGATGVDWPTLSGAPSAETIYYQFRDTYGNGVSGTSASPAMPANFVTTDTTNLNNNTYREFLSWGLATSTFGSYKVYYNTTGAGSSYSLLGTIVDQAQNYYTHTITTATSSTHYYKVVTVSANGDISEFTPVKSDVPDGSGSTDVTPPHIPLAGIAVASAGNVSANITFSTYTDVSLAEGELSTSTVRYASYTGTAPTSCPSANSVSTNTYTVNHSVYLAGLTPSTNYVFCITAKDIAGNVSTASSVASVGGTFSTVGGPVITNVTEREITDISALIFWNTNISSDSKVYYSTSQSGVNSATPASGAIVTVAGTDGAYQHQIGLTGLTAGQTYYFKVVSTDAGALSSTDNNNGQYYSFVTLRDTTPPAVTNIATPVLSPTSAVIVWQTDEPATSQVQWGTASSTYTHSTVIDNTKSIYHIVTLSSGTLDTMSVSQELTPEITYHYVVKSSDMAGNITTSPESTLTTPSTGNITISVVSVRSSDSDKDTTPPSISNVVVSDITPFSAVIKFSTNENTVAEVEAGASMTYGQTASSFDWGTTQTIKLRGLTLGTEYHFRVKAVDKSGNIGTSADQTFKTMFLSENLKDMANVENIEQFQKEIEAAIESILPSLVPPFVTKPAITDITESSATISFKTNIKAFPVVVYAESALYDETKENPYAGEVSDTTEKAVSHELKLTGLKGNTKYHVQARGFSLPKVLGKSVDLTFITKASKIAGSIVERKKDSFTVVWTTGEPTSSIVEFKNIKTGVTERKTEDAKRTSHSMKIENLPSGTAYEVFLSGMTEQGNIAEASSPLSVTTSTDTTAPAISGFKVDNALVPGRTDRIQTIVSWVTDEPSNSTVYYEEGAGTAGDESELANKNEVLDSYVTNHSVILPNLKPGTIYRLKVTSNDDSGNLGSFGPRTVITPRQTESITDIIFKNFEDSFKFLRKM